MARNTDGGPVYGLLADHETLDLADVRRGLDGLAVCTPRIREGAPGDPVTPSRVVEGSALNGSEAYAFQTDGGHGWLTVPRAHVVELGVAEKISGHSYRSRDGAFWYLEEDCDAALFGEAYRTRFGAWPHHTECYSPGSSFVRSLPRVRAVAS